MFVGICMAWLRLGLYRRTLDQTDRWLIRSQQGSNQLAQGFFLPPAQPGFGAAAQRHLRPCIEGHVFSHHQYGGFKLGLPPVWCWVFSRNQYGGLSLAYHQHGYVNMALC